MTQNIEIQTLNKQPIITTSSSIQKKKTEICLLTNLETGLLNEKQPHHYVALT